MNNFEFVARLKEIATKYKTLYVMGCFGAPLTAANKERYIKAQSYNAKDARKAMINAASADTFGFDCVCLIKAVLWGWNGDKSKSYGGAVYASNGVPDIGTEAIIGKCSGVSTNFSRVEVGELLWMPGHVGIYIGDGFCVECTPSWKNCVQITPVLNMGTKNGTCGHKWVKHGKLPYITYETKPMSRTEEISECIVVLRRAGIITEPSKWQKKAEADMDIYWLIKKTAAKF